MRTGGGAGLSPAWAMPAAPSDAGGEEGRCVRAAAERLCGAIFI